MTRLRDLGLLVLLGGLALLAWAPTYSGRWFLLVGVLGLVLGAGATEVSRRRGWPIAAPILMAVVLFVLAGGPLLPAASVPLTLTVYRVFARFRTSDTGT